MIDPNKLLAAAVEAAWNAFDLEDDLAIQEAVTAFLNALDDKAIDRALRIVDLPLNDHERSLMRAALEAAVQEI